MQHIIVQRLVDESRFNRFHGVVLFWASLEFRVGNLESY